jgi:hypothetical protein
VDTPSQVRIGSGTPITFNNKQVLWYAKQTQDCIVIMPNDNDTGLGSAVLFRNSGTAVVGSITTTASATAYNTSSDVRLKYAMAPLAGALDVLRALRPVSHRWQADGSPGVGFLAHELQQVIPDAVTGEPDAINDDGSIRPQQVDHSKLVVWLTAGLQELLAQVETLRTRVTALEGGAL